MGLFVGWLVRAWQPVQSVYIWYNFTRKRFERVHSRSDTVNKVALNNNDLIIIAIINALKTTKSKFSLMGLPYFYFFLLDREEYF